MSVTVDKDELEQEQWDPFVVMNQKPGFKYRFLNKNSRNLAQKLRQGYEIVKDSDPEQMVMTDSTPLKAGEQLDTTKRFNDVVLARISDEKFEKIKARNKYQIQRREASVASQFRAAVGDLAFDGNKERAGGYIARVTERDVKK